MTIAMIEMIATATVMIVTALTTTATGTAPRMISTAMTAILPPSTALRLQAQRQVQ
jgi:hypothetical protein